MACRNGKVINPGRTNEQTNKSVFRFRPSNAQRKANIYISIYIIYYIYYNIYNR